MTQKNTTDSILQMSEKVGYLAGVIERLSDDVIDLKAAVMTEDRVINIVNKQNDQHVKDHHSPEVRVSGISFRVSGSAIKKILLALAGLGATGGGIWAFIANVLGS